MMAPKFDSRLTIVVTLVVAIALALILRDAQLAKQYQYSYEDTKSKETEEPTGGSGDYGDTDEEDTEANKQLIENYQFKGSEGFQPVDEKSVLLDDNLVTIAYPEQRLTSVTVDLFVGMLLALTDVGIDFTYTQNGEEKEISIHYDWLVAKHPTVVKLRGTGTVDEIRVDCVTVGGYKDLPKYTTFQESKKVTVVGENSVRAATKGSAWVISKYGKATDFVRFDKGDVVGVSFDSVGWFLEE